MYFPVPASAISSMQFLAQEQCGETKYQIFFQLLFPMSTTSVPYHCHCCFKGYDILLEVFCPINLPNRFPPPPATGHNPAPHGALPAGFYSRMLAFSLPKCSPSAPQLLLQPENAGLQGAAYQQYYHERASLPHSHPKDAIPRQPTAPFPHDRPSYNS
jgi:hypothetical protein